MGWRPFALLTLTMLDGFKVDYELGQAWSLFKHAWHQIRAYDFLVPVLSVIFERVLRGDASWGLAFAFQRAAKFLNWRWLPGLKFSTDIGWIGDFTTITLSTLKFFVRENYHRVKAV